MTEERKLAEIIARIIDARDGAIKISPNWIATEAMQELDPDRASPMLVHAGCHLQLRQIARQQLRQKYQPDDSAGAEPELFAGQLQSRYPSSRTARAEDPEYILLEHLTEHDISYNVARLRAEARAKLKHADALEGYGRTRPELSA